MRIEQSRLLHMASPAKKGIQYTMKSFGKPQLTPYQKQQAEAEALKTLRAERRKMNEATAAAQAPAAVTTSASAPVIAPTFNVKVEAATPAASFAGTAPSFAPPAAATTQTTAPKAPLFSVPSAPATTPQSTEPPKAPLFSFSPTTAPAANGGQTTSAPAVAEPPKTTTSDSKDTTSSVPIFQVPKAPETKPTAPANPFNFAIPTNNATSSKPAPLFGSTQVTPAETKPSEAPKPTPFNFGAAMAQQAAGSSTLR